MFFFRIYCALSFAAIYIIKFISDDAEELNEVKIEYRLSMDVHYCNKRDNWCVACTFNLAFCKLAKIDFNVVVVIIHNMKIL